MRYYYLPIRMAKIKKFDMYVSTWMWETGTYTLGVNVKLYIHFGRVWQFFKKNFK